MNPHGRRPGAGSGPRTTNPSDEIAEGGCILGVWYIDDEKLNEQ